MQGDSVFEVIAERVLKVSTLSSSPRLYPCVSLGLVKNSNYTDPKSVNFIPRKDILSVRLLVCIFYVGSIHLERAGNYDFYSQRTHQDLSPIA
jgi:hypothetical protein